MRKDNRMNIHEEGKDYKAMYYLQAGKIESAAKALSVTAQIFDNTIGTLDGVVSALKLVAQSLDNSNTDLTRAVLSMANIVGDCIGTIKKSGEYLNEYNKDLIDSLIETEDIFIKGDFDPAPEDEDDEDDD
jgi:ABC-type transporter Mla subunit MlaD